MSDEVGACLGIPGIAAHRAVFEDGPVTGATVLVHAVFHNRLVAYPGRDVGGSNAPIFRMIGPDSLKVGTRGAPSSTGSTRARTSWSSTACA